MPYGNNSEVGICFQDSYGTLNVSSMHWLEILTEDVGLDKPPLVSQSMRGIYDEGQHYEGANVVGGTISGEAQPIALGALLVAAFGAPSIVNSGALYAHTFKPRTSEFDQYSANIPFTMHKYLDDAGSASLFYDLNANGIELGISNGELLMANLEVVGGNFEQLANVAAAYPTGKQWTWDAASISIAAAGVDEIKQLTVKTNESIEAMHTLNGSVFPSRNKRTGFRTVEISGTMTFDNQNEYQEFLNQTERALDVTFTGATEIQSGYYDTVRMIVPLFRHTEYKPVIGAVGEIEVSFSSKGVYSANSGTALQVTLTNTKAAYL